MSRAISVDISIDDIVKQIRKYSWISSYEIFLQSLLKLTSKSNSFRSKNAKIQFQKRKTTGIAIRYITNTRHLGEISVGISLIKKLADLKPPKSTRLSDPNALFHELKKPKLSSVVGDDFKTTDLVSDTALGILEKTESYLSDDVLDGSFLTLEMEKETIQIVNSQSSALQMNSLRTNLDYQFTYDTPQNFINAESNESRRNLNFNYTKIIENVSQTVATKFMPNVMVEPKEAYILLHPEVLGRIIAFQSSLFLSEPPVNDKIIWDGKLFLYDDPLRDQGYQSCFIDDEGTETKSKTLIEEGIHQRGLNTYLHSKWKEGGNAFRNMWFQPVKHSFEYFLKKDATNLILSGGMGKGEKFVQRSGLTIHIKKGHGYIGGIATNPYFVIHSSETEVWKNGNLLGPTKNYTISGSLHDIMTHGDFSADEYQVVDKAIPSAVYIGWLGINPDLISFG